MEPAVRRARKNKRDALDTAESALHKLEADPTSENDVSYKRAHSLAKAAVAQATKAEELEEARDNTGVSPTGSGSYNPTTGEFTDDTNDRSRVTVTGEPRTYSKDSPHSFFVDLMGARQGHADAVERMGRHSQEMAVEGRAISTVPGEGGDFSPPVWLDSWVQLPRASRPVADSLNAQPWIPGTDNINVPKVQSGAAVAVQTDGTNVESKDIKDEAITAAVQTIAGQEDVSQQLVDLSRPGIDQVIWDDLLRAYDTQLEQKVISGSVTNAKGLLELAGTNEVAFTTGSPTVPLLYPKLANGMAQIATGIFRPATTIAMTPQRWAWILASLDSQNRPLVVPAGQPGFNAAALQQNVNAEAIVGTLLGIPVVISSQIPQNGGAGTNQDQILVYRRDEIFLWESPKRVRMFEEVLSGKLQVRFQIYGYYAIMAGRLPKSISKIVGTGLTAPTF